MIRADASIGREALLEFHRKIEPRIYDCEPAHEARITLSRKLLTEAIRLFPMERWPLQILELGCGTADISGPEHGVHEVAGVDCSAGAIEKAVERWPLGTWQCSSIEDVKPSLPRDILLPCETLEHLDNPVEIVGRWFPYCEMAIITHPLDESPQREIGGGEHAWHSLNDDDLCRWALIGGHAILRKEHFMMGGHRFGFLVSRRRP